MRTVLRPALDTSQAISKTVTPGNHLPQKEQQKIKLTQKTKLATSEETHINVFKTQKNRCSRSAH